MQSWGFEQFTFTWIKDSKKAIYVVIIAAIWQSSGFLMAMFLAGLRGIDTEVLRAARVDGATGWRLYWRVFLPQLRPVFLSSFVILGHLAIKSYDLVISLTGGGPGRATEMPSTFMYSYTFTRNQMSIGAASAVIMLMMIASVIIPISMPSSTAAKTVAPLRTMSATRPLTTLLWRVLLMSVLLVCLIFFLLPMFVMLVNSIKSLREIQGGNMLALPEDASLEYWAQAWSNAQIGVQPTGLAPYFWNSVIIVIPAVAISTVLGALNGYVLTKFRFRGDDIIFVLFLFSCFIPFQIILIPSARILGLLGLAGTSPGLTLIHIVYGLGFTTLFFRNYYSSFPNELIRAACIDGAGFWRIFWRIMLPNSLPIIVVSVIWQFTNIWNDFLFGASFADADSQPITVALNNLVNSSTGVKEYNVHFAGAIIAALPTLAVYILSGRYFVRGLMAGAVKG